MRKVIFCLVLCLMVLMSGEVLASDSGKYVHKSNSNVSAVKHPKISNNEKNYNKMIGYSATDGDGSIYINKPSQNKMYFIGEKIHFDFKAYDTWEYVYSGPTVRLINTRSSKRYYERDCECVDTDSHDSYDGDIPTKKVPSGKYRLSVILYPYDHYNDDEPVDDYMDWDLPEANVYLSIEKLKAPKRIKVKAGNNKVMVSFKAAKGASKYEIFRSTKRGSGFKRIKVTAARKFTDRKVKSGKKYFYKVKTIRNKTTNIKSSFSSVKMSGRVK